MLVSDSTSDRTRITLPDGTVEGLVGDGVRRFYSIPYAAPLTKERRFRAPQPVERWDGIRDATRPGPSAPQNHAEVAEIDIDRMLGIPVGNGPDYLTLNVYAPTDVSPGRPVMLFIHGGSFVAGSKDAPVYDGRAFARDGVVCVVINYRVGIEGFLPVAGAATNIGIRDMIAALIWVRDNIAAFGGAAGNVTLFGESGGAWCIAALMTSPLAKGLFHRAICQSGHILLTRDMPVMQRLVKRLARRLKVTPDVEGFGSLAPEQLLPAQDWVMKPSLWFDMRDAEKRDPSFGITRFMPVYGDDVFPLDTIEALRRGAGKEIDLLIGSTSEEARLFFVPNNLIGKLRRWMAILFLKKALPEARAALRAYGFDEKGAKPGEVLARAMTDLMFRWMTRRTAELHRGRSHVYEFEWRSPALGGKLGAAHAVELPFVFDTLDTADGPRGLLGENPPQALADSIHALWIRFATDGSLPWPEYDSETRQVWSLTLEVAAHEPVMPAAAFLP
ncbi:MAG: Para-nitrobenzyl esterase [Sphingomonadales bacterium]|nr:Para-nitrobenzyl esterase [Sphingomonadales bacterium]